jgi:hypothetical protein
VHAPPLDTIDRITDLACRIMDAAHDYYTHSFDADRKYAYIYEGVVIGASTALGWPGPRLSDLISESVLRNPSAVSPDILKWNRSATLTSLILGEME